MRVNGEKAAGRRITLNFVFTDTGEKVVLRLSNGVLSHVIGRTDALSPIEHIAMNEIDHLTRAEVAAVAHRFNQPVAAILFAHPVHCFGGAVGVEQSVIDIEKNEAGHSSRCDLLGKKRGGEPTPLLFGRHA